jgi:hypothetical protein
MTHSPGSKIAIAGDAVPSSLKQQLLLFDKVAVYQLESTIHWCDIISFFYDGSPSTVANDLRFLSEHGLVYDPGHPGEYLQQVLEKGDTWFHGKENPWFDGETEKITLEAVGARSVRKTFGRKFSRCQRDLGNHVLK